MTIAEYAFPPAVPSGPALGGMLAEDHQHHPQVQKKPLTIRAVSTGVPCCAAACLTLKVIWD